MTGRLLSHFEVLEKLGEGGMGVVYKARDTRLDRFVALKVLPPDRIADPERLRRFTLEAKAASALNHPNIVTIYDIDSADGVAFIAMEYIKGKTLEQYIRSRGSLAEVLKYASQITAALAAAHNAGILHRDLKPGNIMIAESGLVKVLDFGLAKLADESGSGEQTRTATLSESAGTEEGKILGTAGYMSPEQAEGKKLDPRTDIFSFGSVLYEMATGRRAFQGETAMSTISMVLRSEPKSITEVAPGTPKELERIVQRCLRKDPARRFQHMDDLKVALEELREETESAKLVAVAEGPGRKRGWILTTTVVGLLACVAAGFYWATAKGTTTKRLFAPVRLTADSGITRNPTFWPEGKLVAYASDRGGSNFDIWVQQLEGGEARRLTTHDADDTEPSFSPDGTKIAFRSERNGGGIFIIPTLGGSEKKILPVGHQPRFSPDGKKIAYWTGQSISFNAAAFGNSFVSRADGADVKQISGFRFASTPVWLRDSNTLLLSAVPESLPRNADFWVLNLADGSKKRLGLAEKLKVDWRSSTMVPEAWTGTELVFAFTQGDSSSLWAVALDEANDMTGEPRQLTSGAALEAGAAVGGNKLIFASSSENTDIWYLPTDANTAVAKGEPVRLTSDLAPDISPSVDGAGEQMVFSTVRAGQIETALMTIRDRKQRVLASSPEGDLGRRNSAPRINLQGTLVAYSATSRQVPGTVYNIADGSTRQLCGQCLLRSWSGDGRRLWTSQGNEVGWLDASTGSFQKSQTKQLLLAAPRSSWDDRWFTGYRSLPNGGIIMVSALDDKGEARGELIQITNGAFDDRLPEFSPNGNFIYFISSREGRADLWAMPLEPATKRPKAEAILVGRLHSARRSPKYTMGGARGISVARDKIVYTSTEVAGNIWISDLN